MAKALILYDGTCGLCDKSVRWLAGADRAGTFQFAPLQGETAADVRARHPELPRETDSVILVYDDGNGEIVQVRSDAVVGAALLLPWPHRALSWFRWVPRPLRDPGYRLVARWRHRLFAAPDVCAIPAPELRRRLLP